MTKPQLSRIERDRRDWNNATKALDELMYIVGKINDRVQKLEESKLSTKIKKLFGRA